MKALNMKYSFALLFAGALVLSALTPIAADAQGGGAIPRLPNGKPDFTGVWDHPRVGDVGRDSNGCAGGTQGCTSKTDVVPPGQMPFTAAGKAEKDKNNKPTTFDYGAHCLPWGYVRSWGTPYPHAYVAHPTRLAMMWEQDNAYHMVPITGQPLPPNEELDPTWRGTSVGRWEGDTLVVETGGFNGQTWLDTAQNPHSDALRVIERMTMTDANHITVEYTFTDPKYYTKPIKNTRVYVKMAPGQELYEYSCNENNRCESGNCTPADVQQ
jgi:hypothetical protein